MSIVEEALHGVWGAIRIIRHDPDAFEEFNISAEGFWRSFAAIVPTAIIAYPLFFASHQFAAETAQADGNPLPDASFAGDYAHLLIVFAAWPIVAALLARQLGLAHNYARYVIADNWIAVPAMAITLIPQLPYLAGLAGWQITVLPSILAFGFLAYLGWYVARRGLETTWQIAAGFLVAQFALNLVVGWLMGS